MVITEDTSESIIREEDEDEAIMLDDIPEAGGDSNQAKGSTRNKRRRGDASKAAVSGSSDTDDSFQFESAPSTKRSKRNERSLSDADQARHGTELQDDKKLGINTSYDGFSIYGRILCLVVKRKSSRNTATGIGGPVSSQQMLENWVSTQAAAEVDDDD